MTMTDAEGLLQQQRLLSRRMIRELVPASDMTLWRWERDGLFPRHVSINGRNYWFLDEINDWLDRKSRDRNITSSAAPDSGDGHDR